MSYSSLWGMTPEYNGVQVEEFVDSWLLPPVVYDIMYVKYLPEEGITGSKKNYFLTSYMLDRTLFGRLNDKLNNSANQRDRVLWELVNNQIFFMKDRPFIVDCIRTFLSDNTEFTDVAAVPKVLARFQEVAQAIEDMSAEEYPYFIWKNTSVDDVVECWFKKYNEEADRSVPKALYECENIVAEFVIIENNEVVGFKNNLQYFERVK